MIGQARRPFEPLPQFRFPTDGDLIARDLGDGDITVAKEWGFRAPAVSSQEVNLEDILEDDALSASGVLPAAPAAIDRRSGWHAARGLFTRTVRRRLGWAAGAVVVSATVTAIVLANAPSFTGVHGLGHVGGYLGGFFHSDNRPSPSSGTHSRVPHPEVGDFASAAVTSPVAMTPAVTIPTEVLTPPLTMLMPDTDKPTANLSELVPEVYVLSLPQALPQMQHVKLASSTPRHRLTLERGASSSPDGRCGAHGVHAGGHGKSRGGRGVCSELVVSR